jgi:predicted lipid-binding transport protein (Tim44 family)
MGAVKKAKEKGKVSLAGIFLGLITGWIVGWLVGLTGNLIFIYVAVFIYFAILIMLIKSSVHKKQSFITSYEVGATGILLGAIFVWLMQKAERGEMNQNSALVWAFFVVIMMLVFFAVAVYAVRCPYLQGC